MNFLLSPNLNDWITLIALCVTLVGLSSLAEKRTVIGVEYGKYLMDKYKVFGVVRIYYLLVIVALINALSLIVMLQTERFPLFSTIVFYLLILSTWFVLYFLFAYILRVHPTVKREIYRKQFLGLYIASDKVCDFEGDRIIGMPSGDRTPKKISSNTQSFFDHYNEDTISAFHEIFGPTSPIYSSSSIIKKEWAQLGYGYPHDYRVHRKDNSVTSVVHISWEFFQMFRFSAIQHKWLLEILNVYNGSYADKYPRLRLYNLAVVFGQINRVGFDEGLYSYKFLDYMMPFIEQALDTKDDEYPIERIPVERYFHEQLGFYIQNTMLQYPASTFSESARKVLKKLVSVEKFRGVISVEKRLEYYRKNVTVGNYAQLLDEMEFLWKKEATSVKNLVLSFCNVLVGWNPDNLFGTNGSKCFSKPTDYQHFRSNILSNQWLKLLNSSEDMTDIVQCRCKEYPKYKKALLMYQDKWMDTLTGEIAGMNSFIDHIPKNIHIYGLSNWCTKTFLQAREVYPILKKVNDYIISGGLKDEDGNLVPAKPDDRIFEVFLKKFDLKKEDCLFVDENFENVQAARRLGIKSIWFLDEPTLNMALEPVFNHIDEKVYS